MHFFVIKHMFQKIPVELPKPPSTKGKTQSLLHAIVGDWYMKKLSEKLPTLKKSELRKKTTRRGALNKKKSAKG